jgi:WD40 repeat protein
MSLLHCCRLGLLALVLTAAPGQAQPPAAPVGKETTLFTTSRVNYAPYPLTVVFSPDGKHLAVVVGGNVVVLDAQSGKTLHTLKASQTIWVSPLAFSPDGKTLASGAGDCDLKLWDVASGRERLTLKGHKERIGAAAFSADGKRLISVSGSVHGSVTNGTSHDARVWDLATGKQLSSADGGGGLLHAFSMSADGQRWAYWYLGSYRIYDLTRGHIHYHQLDLTGMALSPDGRRVATQARDGAVTVADLGGGKVHFRQPAEERPGWWSYLALTADGKSLAVGSIVQVVGQDGKTPDQLSRLRVWDLATGKLLLDRTYYDTLHGMAFSPDGRRLAFCLIGGTVRVVEVRP